MFVGSFQLLRRIWRHRQLIALVLSLLALLLERYRAKLPGPLQRLDLTRLPGVNVPQAETAPAPPEQAPERLS